MAISAANAPCSWGVLEFEPQTPTYSYDVVLDQIAATGYAGTELGDWGFMPTDPTVLRRELERRPLALVGAFVPVALSDPGSHQRGIEEAVRTASLLRDAGYPTALVVLADLTEGNTRRISVAGRVRPSDALTSAQWDIVARGAAAVAAAVCQSCGVRTAFHHHCASFVETAEEIDTLMERTDPALLGLCLDTGHITYAGGDPLAVYERHADRVWHVHFKDCDPRVADEARRQQTDYFTAVRRGVFCELGRGSVDFPALVAALRRDGYEGWAVVEQDVFPSLGSPEQSARRNRSYLRTLGL
jgi:inosose dehydratase